MSTSTTVLEFRLIIPIIDYQNDIRIIGFLLECCSFLQNKQKQILRAAS